ncbi:MAG: TrmH family RNA methyltransferase [Actinomycetes bacterium]
MSPPVHVEDPADPRLGDYTDLTDVALRRVREPDLGLFLAEGEKVLRRAFDAGFQPRSFLLDPRRVDPLSDVLATTAAPVYVAGQEVLAAVTGYRVHRGVLASMRRRPVPSVREVLARSRRVVVCEDVVDHTNVGAVFRSAAALGMDGALLSPRCADPLYRRAVRVSMGAVLTLPYARMGSWRDGIAEVRAAGFRVLALTPSAQATPLDQVPREARERAALLLGTEGDGLSRRWLADADLAVRIPMADGVDSLNVAAAAAVACYALTRDG